MVMVVLMVTTFSPRPTLPASRPVRMWEATASLLQEPTLALMDQFLALSCFINFIDKIIMYFIIISFRLTTRPPRSKTKLHPVEDNVNLSLAEKRYERVRRWTKKVNIFEKDFVIVPINEHSHWFVAVICYPGLDGKRRMDNNEVIPVRTIF